MTSLNDIQEMAEAIVRQFHPERIILFGSHARGEGRSDSDVDLLVVMETDAPVHQRALPIRKALRRFPFPKDILVRTPREFNRARRQFWTVAYSAQREGQVLYER